MKFKDYYEVLGVPRDASQDAIKGAYRKLARKYHPDVSKLADAEARFKELGEAYAVLKDPEKRAAYDQMGSQWKAGQDFQPRRTGMPASNSPAAIPKPARAWIKVSSSRRSLVVGADPPSVPIHTCRARTTTPKS